jgi:hypothetical protein
LSATIQAWAVTCGIVAPAKTEEHNRLATNVLRINLTIYLIYHMTSNIVNDIG